MRSPSFAIFGLLVTSTIAHADPAPAPTSADAPAPAPAFVFKGRALYAGVGAGVLPDVGLPSGSWRLMATLPLARWAMMELFPYGYHFRANVHHPETASAFGIGMGLRVAPWPEAVVRPYLAARFSHLHFWPDPWGHHRDPEKASPAYTSHHRWGGALALGMDTPLLRNSRFRIGFDFEALVLTGPGTNVGLTGMAMLGYAL